ncbi:MAG TPA: ABC transporter ATP-binding protein [Steroidobacteraceae bacterium]|jgi:HlyD family secretion protein
MNIPKRIWMLLDHKQRRHLIGLQLTSIVMALSTVGGLAAVVPFFTVLADPNAIRRNPLLFFAYQRLHFGSEATYVAALGICFAALVLLSNAVNLLGALAINRFALQVGATLHVRLFEEYLRRDYGFHSQTNSAVLASKLLHETGKVVIGILQPGLIFVANLVTVSFVAISMAVLNPLVAAAATLGLGASYAVIYTIARRRLLHNGREESRHSAVRMQLVSETFGAIKEITVLDVRDLFVQRFARESRSIAKAELSTLAVSLSPKSVLECATVFCLVAVALYLRSRSNGVGPWVAQLSFIGFAAYRMLPALHQAFNASVRIRANRPALDHVAADLGNVLTASARVAVTPSASDRSQRLPCKGVLLHEVSFSYSPDRPAAISNLSLEIRAGTSVGLVGGNGSGKTTFTDLLAGLLLPQSGHIDVDGIQLDELTRRAWQASIAYVPQHVFLLDASLAENVAFGVPPLRIDHDRLQRAVRLAHLSECVNALPHGYEERLGERGSRLSGGQRQRLGIARALYRDATLMIMDEATSALDMDAEEAIVDMLETLRPGRTLVSVAHRLGALRHCDMIHELREGRIVRSGSYRDLHRPQRAWSLSTQ